MLRMNTEKMKIAEYIDKEVLDSISTLLSAKKESDITKSADTIAKTFGASSGLFTNRSSDFSEKLASSFQKNMSLLIQKTWIEKSDASVKAQVLYQLSEYYDSIKANNWTKAYPELLQIINNVVYLMFGNQTTSSDFAEYALRIDPEFGIFWYYIKSLPQNPDWSQDKCRFIMQLGMYFLANY